MVRYLNKGFILEQALLYEIESYFDSIHLDSYYPNFHVHVTNSHPFADLFLHKDLKAADTFPCVVITTQNDEKTRELMNLGENSNAVSVSESDLRDFFDTTQDLPGVCNMVDPESEEQLLDEARKKETLYGLKIDEYKTDSISIEIWADNVQLKNELYEQLRLFIGGNLQNILREKYKPFGINIFDGTIRGDRSNNFNIDFGLVLSGANLSFEVNYTISQIIIDTELESENNLIWEVINHVKKG